MRFLIYLTLILIGTVNAAGIHKWVDEEGNVHYGDTPPVSVDTKPVKVIGAPSNPGRALPRLGQDSNQNEPATSTSTDSEETAAIPEDQAKIACENAQKDLQVIKRSTRIRLKAADGTTRVMTPEEIAERRKQSEEDIERFCQ